MGHGASDHKPYRTKEEEKVWEEKCPIIFLRKKMLEEDMKEAEIKDIALQIKSEIDEALEYALNSSEPTIERVKESIFYERTNI